MDDGNTETPLSDSAVDWYVTPMNGRDMEDVLDDIASVMKFTHAGFTNTIWWYWEYVLNFVLFLWCVVIPCSVLFGVCKYLCSWVTYNWFLDEPLSNKATTKIKHRKKTNQIPVVSKRGSKRIDSTMSMEKLLPCSSVEVEQELTKRGLSIFVLHMENEEQCEIGCMRVGAVISGAYGRSVVPWFFKYYNRLVMVQETATGIVVAAAAVHVDVDEDDGVVRFKTRFEAVDKDKRRQRLGSLLFAGVQMFAENYLVEIGYNHGVIFAFVDASKLMNEEDPEHWHGVFMEKNGFKLCPDEDEMDEEAPGIAFGKAVVVGME